MAWIESHQSLQTHRKTKRLCRRLDVETAQAIGHLHCLWWWCVDNAPSGDLSGIESIDMAEAAVWTGDPDVFVQGLMDAGFIDEVDGHLELHDWWEFAGKLIERRRQDAARKRRERQAGTSTDDDPEEGQDPEMDIQRTSNGHPTDVFRTVPNPTNPTQQTNRTQQTQPDQDETTTSEARGAAEIVGPVPDDGDVGIVLRHFPKIQKSRTALQMVRRLVMDRPEVDYEAECSHLEEKAEVDDHPLTRPATALDNWIRKAQFPLVLKPHIHGPPRLAGNGSPPPTPPLPESDEPLWAEALPHLEVSIGAGNVSSWLGEVAASIGDDGVELRCQDEYTRDWLEQRLDRPIRDALATVGLEGQAVKYVVGSAAS